VRTGVGIPAGSTWSRSGTLARVTRPSIHPPTRSSRPPTIEVEATRTWSRQPRPQTADPLLSVRAAIAGVRSAPGDADARRQVRALADDLALRDALVMVLADEAAAANQSEVATALFEVLADIHEDLDQALDAISAMEEVVRRAPDQVDHRDRLAWLYRRAGAWAKAAAEFEQVGALAATAPALAARGHAALRAAGRLYREHGVLDRAAEIYRAIVARRPADDQAWRELDDVYATLGLWSEVADVRAHRATLATGIERAALLRSQARALEEAGQLSAAARVVAEATTHAPEDLSGLVDHADVLARSGRGAEAAELLRVRLAEAIAGDAPAEHVAAIRLQLVAVLDESDDRPAAMTCLAELLAAAPDHLPALERAAAFAATDPDPGVHAHALLRYAAALPRTDPDVIAAAARRFRDARDHRAAARAFEQALQLRPDDNELAFELDEIRSAMRIERAIAEAAKLTAAGRLDAAAAQLHETLDELADAPDRLLARLVLPLARAQAALGDTDEAHRLLHEAHRLDRHDLEITLALGNSCFDRRLWREAARHLGTLAEHPDARRHAAAVAAGLVRASLAETRSLRPANALPHVERAIELDPTCGPAWHALAEDAIARGDLTRAADCLEREAETATDTRDRIRLFDALGDMAHDVLADFERAERCWSQLVDIAEPAVLDKLLAVQRKRGSDQRGRTCLRLAELDADRRKSLREEAAEMLAATGELEAALKIADDLFASHPKDLDAVTCATDVAVAAGDPARIARWLRRALGTVESSAEGAPRIAALWRKLGDAERSLGDPQAARRAYVKATTTAPESDGALAARRGLVELAADGQPATSPYALQSSLFALVEAEPEAGDVLALARELRDSDPDHARATLELAKALGVALDPEDERFYASHPPRAMAPDEVYATRLDARARAELIDDPGDAPLREILEILGEVAPLVCSDARNALLDAGLEDARRVPVTADSAAAAMLPQIGKALEGPPTLLYSSDHAPFDITLLLAAPPVIVLGPGVSDHDDPVLRFQLGRAVELSRWPRVFAGGTSREELAALVDAISAFAPDGSIRSGGPRHRAAERLRSRLPVVQRKRLAERIARLSSPLDPDGYIAACGRAADRAGLLACGDVAIAIELAGGAAAAPHLVQLATGRAYLDARRRLRVRAIEDVTSPFDRR